jgi:hypothetical protein
MLRCLNLLVVFVQARSYKVALSNMEFVDGQESNETARMDN